MSAIAAILYKARPLWIIRLANIERERMRMGETEANIIDRWIIMIIVIMMIMITTTTTTVVVVVVCRH